MQNDLNEIAVFVKVVEQGSFVRAAEALGLPPATVSRRVASLEKRLGVRLLQRTTRKMTLTSAGMRYFERCARILAELQEAERAVTQEQMEAQGTLRITTPPMLTEMSLVPYFERYLRENPKVQMEVLLTDRLVNLVEEGFDAGIRIGALHNSNYVCRRLFSVSLSLYAGPRYLSANPAPATPGALVNHALLAFGPLKPIPWGVPEVDRPDRQPGRRMLINSFHVLRDLAAAGHGIALLPDSLCERELADGILTRLDLAGSRQIQDAYLVYPSRKFMPYRLRQFIHTLTEQGEAGLSESE